MAAPLRARNVGDSTFEDAYDGERYIIPPGEEALVPPEAVALWFGDPSAVNEELVRHRDMEVERLKTRYGHFVSELDSGEPLSWEERHPQFEVLTMEGDPVNTVLVDPQGGNVHRAQTTVNEQEELLSLIKAQSEDLARLKAQFAAKAREAEAHESGHASEDTPKAVASKRSRARGDLRVEVPEDTPAV